MPTSKSPPPTRVFLRIGTGKNTPMTYQDLIIMRAMPGHDGAGAGDSVECESRSVGPPISWVPVPAVEPRSGSVLLKPLPVRSGRTARLRRGLTFFDLHRHAEQHSVSTPLSDWTAHKIPGVLQRPLNKPVTSRNVKACEPFRSFFYGGGAYDSWGLGARHGALAYHCPKRLSRIGIENRWGNPPSNSACWITPLSGIRVA